MANMLAWLTGRDDQTAQPSPVQYDDGQQSLTAYHPSPSEQFGNWISDALGAGPNASLAHQNFATGVPNVLSLFPPLGVGLSAADFAHARAANDPAGAAAAAIGLIPGAGPEARAGVQAAKKLLPWQDETDKALQMISHALEGKPAPEFHPNPVGYKAPTVANTPKDTDIALSAIHDALNPGQAMPEWMQQTTSGIPVPPVSHPDLIKPPAKPSVFDYEKDDNGLYHIFDATSGKTHAVVNTPNEAKSWIAKQQTEKSASYWDYSHGEKDSIAQGKPTSSPYTPLSSSPHHVTFGDLGEFPSTVPFKPPEAALSSGYVTPAVHGTTAGERRWLLPGEGVMGASGDALRLPKDELGVHFGTPDQAQHFTGRQLDNFYQPRTYPTVLKTGKSLELPDSGTWYVDDIKDSLRRLNQGSSYNVDTGMHKVANSKAHVGEFPEEEHAGINSIEGIRDYLSSKGYDSVNYINKVEGKGQRSHIMFKPSPEAPDYAAGVRSPFAAFNPAKMAAPDLAASIMATLGGGTVALPLLKNGDQKQ